MGFTEKAPCSECRTEGNDHPGIGWNEQEVPQQGPGNTAEKDDEISYAHPEAWGELGSGDSRKDDDPGP